MESEIKSTILNVKGVTRITDFDIQLNPDTRKFTVSATYIDIYGNENEVNTDAPNNR